MRRSLLLCCTLMLALAAGGCAFFDSGKDKGGDGTGGVGDPCEPDHGDCRPSLVCTERTCQPSGTKLEGATCTLTGECMEGLYCGPRRTCVPAGEGAEGEPCEATADCGHGLVCVVEGFSALCQPAGDGDLGDECSADADCLAGLSCLPGGSGTARQCGDPPAVDADRVPPRPPFWSGADCTATAEHEGPPAAFFEVPREGEGSGEFYRLPFPNDIRRTDAGLDLSGHPTPGTAVPVDVIGRYVEASEQDLKGFATNPVVYFRFSGRHDFDSIGDGFELVNVDPDSPGFGDGHPAVAWFNTYGPTSNYICPNWVAIRPGHGVPLQPGTTYAVVLSTDVVPHPDVGDAYERSDDLVAVLGDTAPEDPALMRAWQKYEPLRQYLADQGRDPATVLNAAVFTTQQPETMVPRLREAIRAGDAPTVSDLTVCDEGVASPCEDGSGQRACSPASPDYTEIHGRIALPIFQQGTPPYATPEQGGAIETDGSGAPTVARTEDVCFAMTIPTGAAMPAEGWPLMLYLHGTGGSFTGAVSNGLAADMATASTPIATLAIDLPQHGARRGESEESPERLFFNFAHPRAARDNVLQGSADLMSLVYFAEGFAMDATGSPTGEALSFDAMQLATFAHSQGATHASLALPYEPGILAAVLSGNGGDLTQSVLNKTEPIDIAGILPFALLDPTDDGRLAAGDFHPALALFQGFFERVDPVNFARRLHRSPVEGDPGRHVMMTYGLGDSFSPEPTMRAYAVAGRLTLVEPVLTTKDDGTPATFGLPTAAPPLSGNRTIMDAPFTIGMRQYEPNEGDDGHFVATRTDAGRADTTRFVQQALSGATPQIGM